MKRTITFILAIIVLCIIVFGVVEKEDKYNENNSDVLIYSIDSIPTDLQKVVNMSEREEDIICAISRGLVTRDIDGNIVPDLCESYEELDNGIEYRFKIRDNIYWSDGSKITAKDISNFFKELIKFEDKDSLSALFCVYGVNEFKDKLTSFKEGVAITIEDNNIIFRLNKPNEDFINDLARPQYRIKKSLPLWNEIDKYYSEIVYSGYYCISSYNENSINLTRNESYDSKIDNIKVVKDDNEETAMAAFQVGKRNIIVNPPSSTLKELKEKEELLTLNGFNGLYLVINDNNDDLNIATRKAIYKNICNALKSYEKDNDMILELADGSYIKKDKEDLTKLQTRRVSISSAQENIFIKNLSICAVDNESNRVICEYLSKWFKDNNDISLKISIINEEEFLKINENNNYDLILVNDDSKDNKGILFSNLQKYFNNEEKDIYYEEKEGLEYSKLEENIFNNVRIVPLGFLKNNIGISNNDFNIILDYYNNIDFSKLRA